MDAHEARKTAAEMKAFIEQLPPEKIKEIVVRAGIYTPDGKLTKPYRVSSGCTNNSQESAGNRPTNGRNSNV